MAKTLLLFIILLPAFALGQVSITGKIINQSDTKPVANASVFLSNATIGSKTADDGTFTLQNVKPGKYDLVVSIVGFDTYNQTINVENSNLSLQPIIIFPKSIALSQVTIKAEKNDFERKRNLDWFKDEFLGTTPFAKECKILNPEMVDLSYDEKTGTLTGSSVDFLVIENNALGYRIKYLLKEFTFTNIDDKTFSYSGSILFEKMKGTQQQEQEWQKRRQEAYNGSQPHFLRSIITDHLEQEGFRVLLLPANPQRPADSVINEKIRICQLLKNDRVYRDSLTYWQKKAKLPKTLDKLQLTPLTKQNLITGPNKQGLYTLSCKEGALYITYNKYHHFNRGTVGKLSDPTNTDNTLVSFNSPKALFDKNGSLINPQSLTYEGVWLRSRLAGLLPLDYEPQQNNGIETDSVLEKALNAKRNAYTGGHTEKAYLQFDKPYYASGDTIYFKAYVTQGEKHMLSQLSGILHVDLIGTDNKIIRSVKLEMMDGLTWGDFALADTLKGGNYHIRAYTNWMRNAGSDYFFDQVIPIASTTEVKKTPEGGLTGDAKQIVKATYGQSDVQFFAEGGNLLTGLKSKIAFKAIAPDGLGTAIKGVITDNENRQITTFASNAMGMGLIELTPQAGKTYKANITYTDGTTGTVELPKAVSNGYQLNIDNTTDANTLKISVSGGKQNSLSMLSIVAQSGGIVCYSAKNNADSKNFNVDILRSDLPTGIVQFTLFTSSGEPLNERLVFINNNDQLKIGASFDKTTYTSRQKVKISLDAKNKFNQPVNGGFSVSVTDETKVPVDEAKENTILTNLLLTSELKGTIEKPNYYFTNITQKTSEDLDALMLTQGYHHFEWKQVLNNGSPVMAYQPERSMEISGRVKKNGKPLVSCKVTLFTTSGGTFLIDTLTDTNGKFAFKNLAFNDSVKFVVQAKVAKGQDNVVLELDSSVTVPPVIIKTKAVNGIKVISSNEIDMSAYVQNQKQFSQELQKYGINKHELLLKEVIVKDKKAPKELENSQNLNGKGNADQVITAKDLDVLGCRRLSDCIQYKAPLLIYSEGNFYNPRAVQSFDGSKPYALLLVVDGVVTESDLLNDINSRDVESIELVVSTHYAVIYGPAAAAGVIIITTKRARNENNYYRYAPGVVTIKPKGFYKAREFYSPQYDNPKTNQKINDLRSTIYWKPDIITDKDGKASFEYFNADGKGIYRVVIEGIDGDGNLGRQVYRYTVQ